jgi:hypothetical protein
MKKIMMMNMMIMQKRPTIPLSLKGKGKKKEKKGRI